jgi:tetraacyldisaccharide 4'-kinase
VSFDRTLQRVWYERSPALFFLLLTPLSLLFAVLAAVRRSAFRVGLFRSVRVSRPVIVVGNITVGGTGKTPLVVWICEFLQARGIQVGVVTRGYGGTASTWPQDITCDSSAEAVGDEAVLTATRTNAIVVASPDRVEAAQRAIARGAEVVVSDDGLQHYRLARDAEIAVLDGRRGLGNGWLLPAGPLREARSRLNSVDLVVATSRGATESDGACVVTTVDVVLRHEIHEAQCLTTGERRKLAAFEGVRVHAIAAIGNPDAFFAMLRAHGLEVDAHPLPDHAAITPSDISFAGSAPILMTEKDAVKCRSFATGRLWVVPLQVRMEEAAAQRMAELLLRVAKLSANRTVKP